MDRNYSGEIMFLHSESDQLYSDLVNVTVGKLLITKVAYLIFVAIVNWYFFL